MNTLKFYILFLIFFLLFHKVHTQVSNYGELFISKETDVFVEDSFTNTKSGKITHSGYLYFSKNFSNEGVFAHNMFGDTFFIGSELQQIANTSECSFFNLTFNQIFNEELLYLVGNIKVENQFDLTSGSLFIADDKDFISLGLNSSHINASNNSYIFGHVKKIGDKDFTFPVGANNNYRPIKISSPNTSEVIFLAKFIPLNSDELFSHENKTDNIEFIDTSGYWTLENTNTDSDVIVTLNYDEAFNDFELFENTLDEIHIVRWDTEKQFWTDEGGVLNVSERNISTTNPISKFGVFALGRVKSADKVIVYNMITPNGDGKNDFFRIEGINTAKNIHVSIFNRNGVKVYESDNYNNTTNNFRGFSNGRITIARHKKLPTGTYFYILKYESDAEEIKKAGYLYINGKE